MIIDHFRVKLEIFVDIPYAEGVMFDGSINRNHLMYLAQKKVMDEERLVPHKMIYSFHFGMMEKNELGYTDIVIKPLTDEAKQYINGQ